MSTFNPLLVIPARLNSTRLPRKVMADIEGKSMIVRVFERCQASQVGPVLVACDSQEIADEIIKLGGHICLTDPDLPSGSDRAYAAICKFDPQKKYDVIVCVQGDIPTLDPKLIKATLDPLKNSDVDIATLASEIIDESEILSPHVVKIALTQEVIPNISRALYFSRAPIPYGSTKKYHHIGLYAYKRAALEKYVSLSPSLLEGIEKLEQLRALEAGMRIDVSLVDTVPLGVDTFEDLVKARLFYQNTKV